MVSGKQQKAVLQSRKRHNGASKGGVDKKESGCFESCAREIDMSTQSLISRHTTSQLTL